MNPVAVPYPTHGMHAALMPPLFEHHSAAIAALNMHYPGEKLRVYVLDDGGQAEVQEMVRRLASHARSVLMLWCLLGCTSHCLHALGHVTSMLPSRAYVQHLPGPRAMAIRLLVLGETQGMMLAALPEGGSFFPSIELMQQPGALFHPAATATALLRFAAG